MERVKFRKGFQRKFFKKILFKLNCPSLRNLNQFGFDIPYSTLKNYYSELRLIPKDFFSDLCYLAKISEKSFNVFYLKENWGKIKGGKTGKRK